MYPPNDPFIPPPPPQPSNPLFPPNVLEAKSKLAASEARDALILSIVGLACFGFILGILAIKKANSALETISIYGVAADKQGLVKAARVLGIIDIVLWALALVIRIGLYTSANR